MAPMPAPVTSSRENLPSPSKWPAIKAFVKDWFRIMWLDLIVMALIGAICIVFDQLPLPFARTFPITFHPSGDIVFPQLAYPDRGWILPPLQAGLLSILGPISIYLAAQPRIRSAWDLSAAVMGTLWAVLLGTLCQVTLKFFIGGLRPIFLDICAPDLSLATGPGKNASGLNGIGFGGIMYSPEICTQTNARKLRNALTSFPSGHATVASAGFGFVFLWINAKLKVWGNGRPAFWKLLAVTVPLLDTALIAGSLTVDSAHNVSDILMGLAIGGLLALGSYRMMYAAVWDYRYNHIPLQLGSRTSGNGEDEEGYSMEESTTTGSANGRV